MSGVEPGRGLEALLKALENLSDEDLTYLAEKLSEVDVKKLADLMATLSQNADGLIALLALAGELKEKGILASMGAVVEAYDELFNAMARPEMMKAMGNMMMLVYMLSQLDHGMLMQLAESMPKCSKAAMDEMKNASKGMGFKELMDFMRSPEMAALLKAAARFSRCMRE